VADVVDLTDATFDAETSQGVALVDFWAPWWRPVPACSTRSWTPCAEAPGAREGGARQRRRQRPGWRPGFNVASISDSPGLEGREGVGAPRRASPTNGRQTASIERLCRQSTVESRESRVADFRPREDSPLPCVKADGRAARDRGAGGGCAEEVPNGRNQGRPWGVRVRSIGERFFG